MIEVRTARIEDREEIRALWRTCFGDSERFMDWYFQERFYPDFSVCLLKDGVIVSALQSCPLHVHIRGKIVGASMLTGVSTHPAHAGQGYMRKTFTRYMQLVREQGLPFSMETPAHMGSFFTLGHYPTTDTMYLDIPHAAASTFPQQIQLQDMHTNLAPLHTCYQRFMRPYSGSVSRTMADFALKFRDYASDGAQCYVVADTGAPAQGYCVFFQLENRVHVEECVFDHGDALRAMLQALQHTANGRQLTVKLPPDTALATDYRAYAAVRPQGAMGLADVAEALKLLVCDSRFVFEIIDSTVPQNSGVWNGAGLACTQAPDIQLEASKLCQFLCGYRSLSELAANGEANIYNIANVETLDNLLQKQRCFVVDEY
ncbi:GNAT family N-acetyltransferase [Christensenellaceae bacterium OttesenSCG-928-L17]|nr:GNAT family N-acetyltransferase [Christensenellaceae bacterium OttesenSCG-928-L17]